jgi:hypothetical protein
VATDTTALTEQQAEQSAALDRIDSCGREFRQALEAAFDAGCAPEAISSRTITLISTVFGVDEATLKAMSAMVGV